MHQGSSKQDDIAKHMQQFKASLKTQRLAIEDMAEAEKAIICFVQKQSFPEELASLVKDSQKDKFFGPT